MKITVFGGSGFLGSHVCDKLTAAGHAVTIFDIKDSPWRSPNQKMIVGNMLDVEQVDQAVAGADVVFNFSGIADIDECASKPLESIHYNIYGNCIVLEACRKFQVKRFIFASTIYVYSKSGSFYRCSKQASELYIEQYRETYGLDYTILRYGSLYGPRSDSRNAIYRFVYEALKQGSITYHGDEEALREYIHVEDAACCSVDVLKSEFANQNIILTGHQPMKVKDLLKMIAEILHRPVDLRFLPQHYSSHYATTPYYFSPKVGYKMTPNCHIDMGQGLLRMIESAYLELHPELHVQDGMLVKDKG